MPLTRARPGGRPRPTTARARGEIWVRRVAALVTTAVLVHCLHNWASWVFITYMVNGLYDELGELRNPAVLDTGTVTVPRRP